MKLSGVPNNDIATVFMTTIRPVIEYACPVYNHMLTGSQIETLEAMQRRCFKIIYGHQTSYREARERSGAPLLSERRKTIVEKFTHKTANDPRW